VDVAKGPEDGMAAPDEVVVGPWVVVAPHDRPHGGDRGVDLLHHSGAPLVRGHDAGVVAASHHVGNNRGK